MRYLEISKTHDIEGHHSKSRHWFVLCHFQSICNLSIMLCCSHGSVMFHQCFMIDLSNQNLSYKISKTLILKVITLKSRLWSVLLCHFKSTCDPSMIPCCPHGSVMFSSVFHDVIYQTRIWLTRYLEKSNTLILKVIIIKSCQWSVLLCHFKSICDPSIMPCCPHGSVCCINVSC